VALVRLSHLIDLALNRFVPFVNDFHHVRIQQIDEEVGTQQNNNGRETNTHEFVLLKVCFVDDCNPFSRG